MATNKTLVGVDSERATDVVVNNAHNTSVRLSGRLQLASLRRELLRRELLRRELLRRELLRRELLRRELISSPDTLDLNTCDTLTREFVFRIS